MGLFHVKGQLTGATLSVVPQALAQKLGQKGTHSQCVVIAGGQHETWPIAEARLKLNTHEITTPCVIAPDGPVLLGAVVLESLFVAVDPIGKRLIPVDGLVG